MQPLNTTLLGFVLQLQVEQISATNGGYYQSMSQAVRRIVAEESVSALWKGHIPGQFLSILFTSTEVGRKFSFAVLKLRNKAKLILTLNNIFIITLEM